MREARAGRAHHECGSRAKQRREQRQHGHPVEDETDAGEHAELGQAAVARQRAGEEDRRRRQRRRQRRARQRAHRRLQRRERRLVGELLAQAVVELDGHVDADRHEDGAERQRHRVDAPVQQLGRRRRPHHADDERQRHQRQRAHRAEEAARRARSTASARQDGRQLHVAVQPVLVVHPERASAGEADLEPGAGVDCARRARPRRRAARRARPASSMSRRSAR